ncbi:MAG: Si-specific NAD(P)(+) transhydrogenase [Phycisphaerae bacterium]|nr:Si-specific NAD(P)(+) transhydrogenase [Phycisphaerae bacterium]
MRYCDLCVIGSGPGGQKAAIQAAKLGKDVVVIEKMEFVGGVAINTGTIPSKALREAVLAITSAQVRAVGVSESFTGSPDKLQRLMSATQRVIRAEIDVVRSHFATNDIHVIQGVGSFVDDKTVQVDGVRGIERIHAEKFLVAVGTSPARPASVPFDRTTVITSDEILHLPTLPRSMIIVGGGVIGTEYASMLTPLGVKVTLIEGRPRLLDFVDAEIIEALQYNMRQSGVVLRMGEKVVTIKRIEAPAGSRAESGSLIEAVLESGKTLRAECLMYCIGRQGATDLLSLASAGLKADERGRLKVNEFYQTEVPHIYACGDVIGFPALASTSMEQGRLAACHMFSEPREAVQDLLPYGIYAIPEISMVGWTEERLTQEGIPYESGIAQYREIARGQLLDDEIGMLKLLIHQDSHAVLGVHVIGTGATELVHIGQAVMAFKGTAEYFVNAVFNYPTLAECYKVAAYNALNKLKNV